MVKFEYVAQMMACCTKDGIKRKSQWPKQNGGISHSQKSKCVLCLEENEQKITLWNNFHPNQWPGWKTYYTILAPQTKSKPQFKAKKILLRAVSTEERVHNSRMTYPRLQECRHGKFIGYSVYETSSCCCWTKSIIAVHHLYAFVLLFLYYHHSSSNRNYSCFIFSNVSAPWLYNLYFYTYESSPLPCTLW